ncbi:uncharacterized protein LOC106151957 [Lingula anatina]|uniref:Uncharacterized protein LOC106151957 n=1 Tax=Lingula anatina TaxID=7574 RepID=A0A1S3H4H2_LINAN|nr:uncharacterized protein LOC106151957 [Lingula anatina]|eukprot:XP_013380862.1 uncharacterized protein LOC106151957 [Lingula anatina]
MEKLLQQPTNEITLHSGSKRNTSEGKTVSLHVEHKPSKCVQDEQKLLPKCDQVSSGSAALGSDRERTCSQASPSSPRLSCQGSQKNMPCAPPPTPSTPFLNQPGNQPLTEFQFQPEELNFALLKCDDKQVDSVPLSPIKECPAKKSLRKPAPVETLWPQVECSLAVPEPHSPVRPPVPPPTPDTVSRKPQEVQPCQLSADLLTKALSKHSLGSVSARNLKFGEEELPRKEGSKVRIPSEGTNQYSQHQPVLRQQ